MDEQCPHCCYENKPRGPHELAEQVIDFIENHCNTPLVPWQAELLRKLFSDGTIQKPDTP